MPDELYVLQCTDCDCDCETLFFSNADGWGDLASADVYTIKEIENYKHIPLNSKWTRKEQAELQQNGEETVN